VDALGRPRPRRHGGDDRGGSRVLLHRPRARRCRGARARRPTQRADMRSSSSPLRAQPCGRSASSRPSAATPRSAPSPAGPAAASLRFALAIVPATICLGATLPAIGQALAPVGTLRWRGALLYALNTVGAMLGIAAAGFGLPAAIGVVGSYGLAAALSATAGLLALSVARQADLRAVGAAPAVSPTRPPERPVAAEGGRRLPSASLRRRGGQRRARTRPRSAVGAVLRAGAAQLGVLLHRG